MIALALACAPGAEAPPVAPPPVLPAPPVRAVPAPPGPVPAVTRLDADCAGPFEFVRISDVPMPPDVLPGFAEDCYDHIVYAMPNDLGFVRVRAQPIYQAGFDGNVLGTLPTPAWFRAFGPMKYSELSAGLGWALLVEDRNGRRCQGYVSATVVADMGAVVERCPSE